MADRMLDGGCGVHVRCKAQGALREKEAVVTNPDDDALERRALALEVRLRSQQALAAARGVEVRYVAALPRKRYIIDVYTQTPKRRGGADPPAVILIKYHEGTRTFEFDLSRPLFLD